MNNRYSRVVSVWTDPPAGRERHPDPRRDFHPMVPSDEPEEEEDSSRRRRTMTMRSENETIVTMSSSMNTPSPASPNCMYTSLTKLPLMVM